jgi:hypothetical protein
MGEWIDRFSHVIPKEEIVRKIRAMNADLTTPWTFKRMAMEIKGETVDRRSIEIAAKTGKMSDRTQIILSRFLREIESGRLRVFYEDPNARRYVWGTKHPETPGTPEYVEARKNRKIKNRVTVIRTKLPVERVVKQLQVSIGVNGPKLKPQQKVTHDLEMPSFSDVVKLK